MNKHLQSIRRQMTMKTKLYLFIAALLVAGGVACVSAELETHSPIGVTLEPEQNEFVDCVGAGSEADSPLGITLKPDKNEFENGERIGCGFEISNRTAQAVTVPDFHFRKNVAMDSADANFYWSEGILKIDVWQGANKLANKNWPTVTNPYPTVVLQPGQTVSQYFILNDRYPTLIFFDLTNLGSYSVSIALDTTGCKDAKIPKGVFVSPRADFKIVPFPVFRAKQPDESPETYAQAKVTFYLKNKGEYFQNVGAIAYSDGAVATLTELLGSPDKDIAGQSLDLLISFYEPLDGRTNHPPLPKSVEEWRKWAKETGSKLTPGELFGNFDSHFQ